MSHVSRTHRVGRDSFIHEHIITHHLRSIRVHDEFVRRDSFIHLSLTHGQTVLISRHAYAWVMQYTAMRHLTHLHESVCCSVLQCVAVCCSVLQCVAVRHLTHLHESCHTLYLWRCISDDVLWCVRESSVMMCSWCISDMHQWWCVMMCSWCISEMHQW